MKTHEEDVGALKNWMNADVLKRMEEAIRGVYPAFRRGALKDLAPQLKPLELKARMHLVRDALHANLPHQFPQALKILLQSLEKSALQSTDLWPYSEFIQTYGLDDFEKSMDALYFLTSRFTSEFAVRPFLVRHQKATLQKLSQWAKDPSIDIRRWVSEGTRPRLPWGLQLKEFVKNPSLTLPLLEKLKYDPELYVRKSVANHLNDISKDHPEVVLSILKKWKESAPTAHQEKISWITRHSLRTLIKKGNPKALALMGVSTGAKVKLKKFVLNRTQFKMNDVLEFSVELQSEAAKEQKLIVDYVIHHQKSNEETTPKVFKLKTLHLKGKGLVLIEKRHALKPITTRKYYSGKHLLEIQVNGKILGRIAWDLRI